VQAMALLEGIKESNSKSVFVSYPDLRKITIIS